MPDSVATKRPLPMKRAAGRAGYVGRFERLLADVTRGGDDYPAGTICRCVRRAGGWLWLELPRPWPGVSGRLPRVSRRRVELVVENNEVLGE